VVTVNVATLKSEDRRKDAAGLDEVDGKDAPVPGVGDNAVEHASSAGAQKNEPPPWRQKSRRLPKEGAIEGEKVDPASEAYAEGRIADDLCDPPVPVPTGDLQGVPVGDGDPVGEAVALGVGPRSGDCLGREVRREHRLRRPSAVRGRFDRDRSGATEGVEKRSFRRRCSVCGCRRDAQCRRRHNGAQGDSRTIHPVEAAVEGAGCLEGGEKESWPREISPDGHGGSVEVYPPAGTAGNDRADLPLDERALQRVVPIATAADREGLAGTDLRQGRGGNESGDLGNHLLRRGKGTRRQGVRCRHPDHLIRRPQRRPESGFHRVGPVQAYPADPVFGPAGETVGWEEFPQFLEQNRLQAGVGSDMVAIHSTPPVSYPGATMRVSSLPPVLSPGRISDLLRSGAVLPVIAVDGAALSGDDPAFFLAPAEEVLPTARPESADRDEFARLLGDILRVARVEAIRSGDVPRYSCDIPEVPRGWILDRTLLWTFLAGMWGRPQPPGGMGPPRRVDSSELLSLERDQLPWTVRLSPSPGADQDAEVSWLILEHRPESREGNAAPLRPSQSVATAAQRIRDHLRAAGWGSAAASVHPQDHAAIRGGSGMMRLDGDGFRVYWPLRSFHRVLTMLAAASPPSVTRDGKDTDAEGGSAGADSPSGDAAAVWNALQFRALLGVLQAELRGWGLLRLVQMHPRTETEKRSRTAVRTVVELIRADGAPRRSLVDSVYRDGEAYRAASVLFAWCSSSQQRDLRSAFGPRRWEQLVDHALRRPPAVPTGSASVFVAGSSGDDPRYPWNSVALAADLLVRRLASRVVQPGRRPPAATVDIIRRSYIDARSQRLRSVLHNQIDRGVLEQLLEDVFLSQLRRDLPRLPREVIVLAATGETPAVRDRLAAVFSRRGREMFREDVAAVERAIERGEFSDWDRVLAARQRVWGLYRGSGRSRSRISPA
jgi:hypothetical protein